MQLYDSYSKTKKTISQKEVSVYLCGPTVYSQVHLGNLRPIVIFDVLVRTLRALGSKVIYIHNFTDVDDKIIAVATQKNTHEAEVAKINMDHYLKIWNDLALVEPDFRPQVTTSIAGIIEYIQNLVVRGYAYEAAGNVFFDITKISHYGRLSQNQFEKLTSVSTALQKKHPGDFTLWKKTTIGINWKSPWGAGRPGWHTECAYFAKKYSAGFLDIHGGGVDLKFPHHENEIAQSLATNGKPLANIWLHVGHLLTNAEKMAKSSQNFVLGKDILAKWEADDLKAAYFLTSYTRPVDFNEDLLIEGKQFVTKITNTLKKGRRLLLENNSFDLTKKIIFNKQQKLLLKPLEDNLNIPNFLREINELATFINSWSQDSQYSKLAINYNLLLWATKTILGLTIKNIASITVEDEILIRKWIAAKKHRNFIQSDHFRKILLERNLI